jgi:hypothetical protein
MKKLFIFSLITSSIITLIACNSKDTTVDLKQAKTTREAIQAISGLEYRLTTNDSIYIKLSDIGTKEELVLGRKIADAGIVSNIKFIDNSDLNKPYEYVVDYYNQKSKNEIWFHRFNIYLHSDTLEMYLTRTQESFIFKRKAK